MQSKPPSRKTNILFICHDGKIYGSQKSLKLLVEHLPRDRYQLFVSFSREGPLVDIFKADPQITLFSHKRVQTVKHSERGMFKRVGDIAALFLNMNRVLPLVKIIRDHNIDLVHTNSIVSLEGAIAAKLAGVPHVWHIRELFEDYNPRFHLILGKSFMKSIVHNFSARVIPISNCVYRQFQPYADRFPGRYSVIYNAIESPTNPAFNTNMPVTVENSLSTSDALNMVYMGRVSDGKRFQDLLEAFCILKRRWQENMPFNAKVYGEFISPDFERTVREKIQDAGLEKHVRLLGYNDDIDDCFSSVNLLLMPSSNEAFGRTILEAMVRGVPVLAARSGAPLEIIEEGKTGFFHLPNDGADLAASLERIYENCFSLSAMPENCINSVQERFSIAQQIDRLDNLYQEIIRRNLHARAC